MLKMLYKTYTFVERDGMCRYNTVLRDLPIRSRLKKNTHCCDDTLWYTLFLSNFFSEKFYSNFFWKKLSEKVRYRKKWTPLSFTSWWYDTRWSKIVITLRIKMIVYKMIINVPSKAGYNYNLLKPTFMSNPLGNLERYLCTCACGAGV